MPPTLAVAASAPPTFGPASSGAAGEKTRRRSKRTSGAEQQAQWAQARRGVQATSKAGAAGAAADDVGGFLSTGGASAEPGGGSSGGSKHVTIGETVEVGGSPVRAGAGGGGGDDGNADGGGSASLVTSKRENRQLLAAGKELERSEKHAAKEAERQELLARRQHDALVMLRNIPFVECRIVEATTVREARGERASRTAAPHARTRTFAHSHARTHLCVHSATAGARARTDRARVHTVVWRLVRQGRGSYIAFHIELCVPKDEFKAASHSVHHRFSRFASMHEGIARSWGRHAALPALPAKKWQLGGLNARQVEERRASLEAYLQHLVRVLNWAVEPNLRTFFEADRWLKERRTRTRAEVPAATGAVVDVS